MVREQEQGDPDYVVLGAGGPTGLHVVNELVKQCWKVRAVVRRPEGHGEIAYVAKKLEDQAFGDAEIELAKGDVTDYASVVAACKGAKGVFFTASGKGYFSAHAVDHKDVENAARAAKEQGLDRVVVVSSAFVSPHRYLHPIRMILNSIRFRLMDYKFQGEEALRRSGVPYTVVRPGRLTDGPAGEAAWALSQGDSSAGGGGVARADVARIAVAAMLSPAAANTTFEVLGVKDGPKLDPADAVKSLLKDKPASPGPAGEGAGGGSEGRGGATTGEETLPEAGGAVNKIWRALVILPVHPSDRRTGRRRGTRD